jgi:hypothetical protein
MSSGLHLVPSLRISGAISLLLHMPVGRAYGKLETNKGQFTDQLRQNLFVKKVILLGLSKLIYGFQKQRVIKENTN